MPVKMKHSMMPQKVMTTLNHVAQCLEEWESHIPRPAHSDLKKQWTNEMKEYLESINGNEDTMVDSIIYGLIEAYNEWDGDDYSMAVEHEKTYALMQRPQTTQRTADWYLEFKRCLTASELFKVFGSVRERGMLVMQKAGVIELSGRGSTAVVLRQNMSPFDWGICFEPVVKQILEAHWEAIIHDVGRFVHLKDTRLAASPDGLIIRSLKTPEMGGHLLEIKCPKSRTIGLKIPMEYFYQMQHQLEVTGVRACEYVEAKFAEDAPAPAQVTGYISLFVSESTDEMKYVYHDEPSVSDASSWLCIETYSWTCTSMRRTIVARDRAWFEKMRPDIDLFWKEVTDVREGRRILEPPKKRAVPVPQEDTQVYSFVDD